MSSGAVGRPIGSSGLFWPRPPRKRRRCDQAVAPLGSRSYGSRRSELATRSMAGRSCRSVPLGPLSQGGRVTRSRRTTRWVRAHVARRTVLGSSLKTAPADDQGSRSLGDPRDRAEGREPSAMARERIAGAGPSRESARRPAERAGRCATLMRVRCQLTPGTPDASVRPGSSTWRATQPVRLRRTGAHPRPQGPLLGITHSGRVVA